MSVELNFSLGPNWPKWVHTDQLDSLNVGDQGSQLVKRKFFPGSPFISFLRIRNFTSKKVSSKFLIPAKISAGQTDWRKIDETFKVYKSTSFRTILPFRV